MTKLKLFDEDVLTPQETADCIGVTNTCVLRWIKEGTLKAFRVGGRYFVPESSLKSVVKPAVQE